MVKQQSFDIIWDLKQVTIVSDYLETRQILADNVDKILEAISAKRQQNLIASEDLFGEVSEGLNNINWNKPKIKLSKKDILLKEREALGLYVSGSPVDDFRTLQEYSRNITNRNDIFLILIDKVKKIFTRNNTMMFAIHLTMLDKKVEGIIFPKNALRLAPNLQEGELVWVKGRVSEKKKKNENINPEEVRQYDELPKLIIEEVVPIIAGPGGLFEGEEIPLSVNKRKLIDSIDWKSLAFNPKKIPEVKENTKISPDPSKPKKEKITDLILTKGHGLEKLNQVKSMMKSKSDTGLVAVKIKVETGDGLKTVKGIKYLPKKLVQEILN